MFSDVSLSSLAQQHALCNRDQDILQHKLICRKCSKRWHGGGTLPYLTSRDGVNCALVADGGVGAGRKEESFALISRRGEIPTLDPGSTLLVAGSLFVGNGLGVRKTPTVFAGGSAKNMCRKIVEEQSCALGGNLADDCD